MPLLAPLLAQTAAPSQGASLLPWLVAGSIFVVGLLIYGFRDVLRLSIIRIWTISGVCFRDAIRRKVLWVTPLAMLGILVVTQLQHPIDEQDAIRLTIKFCFFTTAIVVTVTSVILAATNLPREIENRVIFTIVTKPVTRLEIVLGKLLGFARVSAAILLIMGLFTWGYLHLRASFLQRAIATNLEVVDSPSLRETLRHQQDEGLLVSRSIAQADGMQFYARPPNEKDPVTWMAGVSQQAIVPFQVQRDALKPASLANALPGEGGLVLSFHMAWQKTAEADDPSLPPLIAAPAAQRPIKPPTVGVELLDRGGSLLMGAEELKANALTLADPAGKDTVSLVLDPQQAIKLGQNPQFVFQITGNDPHYIYGIPPDPIALMVPDDANTLRDVHGTGRSFVRGAPGRRGQQLFGPQNNVQPVAIFHFKRPGGIDASDGTVPIELRAGIENSGLDVETEDLTTVEIRVLDKTTGTLSDPIYISPENDRTAYAEVPAALTRAGDFDVLVRNLTVGHVVELAPDSVTAVAARDLFVVNLIKALAVLWLFSILVVAIALCWSTFLTSWAIAIVATLIILLGRWAVEQLGGTLAPGFGAQVANSWFPDNAQGANVISSGVDALSFALLLLASVLPDINAFAVTELIESGVTISLHQLIEPLLVLALFVLPLTSLSYVFLRNKEVAP